MMLKNYEKDKWGRWFEELSLNALKDETEDHLYAGTSFPVKQSIMEGIARPLWGIIPLHLSGYDEGIDYRIINDRLLSGILSGECSWGEVSDYSHHAVEMAPIAMYLYCCRDVSWDLFSEFDRKCIYEWLFKIKDISLYENNWLFFRILTLTCLDKLMGEKRVQEICDEDFNKIESMYVGNGWYSDGYSRQRDYYVAFTMHYYSLIYSVLNEKNDRERAQKYKRRAAAFAKDYIYWFSAGGNEIPFGRSLIYRFAHIAYWGMLNFAKVETEYSDGVIKGIILRNLRWWSKQDIYYEKGLKLGYLYPNTTFLEEYNGFSSSYWCLKAACVLLANDEFWGINEEQYPKLNLISEQQESYAVLVHNVTHTSAMAFINGQWIDHARANSDAKYCKFVYSNLFGFSVCNSNVGLSAGGYDNTLAVSYDDEVFFTRNKLCRAEKRNDVLISKWQPVYGIEIISYVIIGNPTHIRVHKVTTKVPCIIYDGGFSVGNMDDISVRIEKENNEIELFGNGLCSKVQILYGNGKVGYIKQKSGTSLYYPRAGYPYSKFYITEGTHIIASLFCGMEDGEQTGNTKFNINENGFQSFVGEKIVF